MSMFNRPEKKCDICNDRQGFMPIHADGKEYIMCFVCLRDSDNTETIVARAKKAIVQRAKDAGK